MAPPAPGHIKLTITENQSLRPPQGQIYRGIKAATQHTAQAVGIALTLQQIDTIADKGTVYGTAVAVAIAVGALQDAATRALDYTAWVGLDTNNVGIIATALQTRNGGGNANAVSTAAAQVDGGHRIGFLGNGAAEAIGAAMTGSNANAISQAATLAGATPNAANAAGHAAATVYNTTKMNPDDAGYAVAAAMGAVAGGATVAQGSAIAAAIAATVAVVDAATTARVTTKAAIAAGMANNLAALAGAVAAASYYEGVPHEVFKGVLAALQAANFPDPLPTNQANAAEISATIPANDLFNLQFQCRGDMGQTKNYNIAHCY